MDQPTWIGRTLSGRYKIDGMLGQGGMSAVYRAMDPNLRRVVAIKLIHPHLSSDPSFVTRFESEAAAVASLRHQNIVQVYDFNSDNGVYYMVLEFIPGETLQDRVKRLAEDGRKLSFEDALKFTNNISDAVGYAHQRGMVHRDIKPANIMLDMQGQAILMDFGIVKILGGDSHTSTGAVVGTARYMSPEIIRGEVADHRSDIYSLGVTLYEMLSGRPPFVADSAITLMMMHLNDPVPDVRSFRSDVHPEIVSILENCMAKNREDRYQSAAKLSADLKQALGYLGGQPAPIRAADTIQMPKASAAKTDSVPVSQHFDQINASSTQGKPAPATQIAPQPLSPSPTPPPPGKVQRPGRFLWLFGAGFVFICCVGISLFALRGQINLTGTPTETVTPTNTTISTAAPIVSIIPSLTLTPLPAVTETPSATPTPSGPYVVITGIRLENNTYVVDYEVHNFPESASLHVHMFFNTVPPDQAGSPGAGPWKLTWGQYGDPPFTQYGTANRPADATQMCALVANPNHSIIPGTGNCFTLPY